MINNTTVKNEYTTTGNLLTVYPITFQGATDDNGYPLLKVTITVAGEDTQELHYNSDYTLAYDENQEDNDESLNAQHLAGIKLLSAEVATSGNLLTIARNTPFVQPIDFQVGRIDPEQVEKAVDLSVLRDQELRASINSAIDASEQAVETADEAKEIAQEAHDTAEEAKETAESADNKSDEAVEIAQAAQDAVSNIYSERFVFTINSGQTTLHFDESIEDKVVDLYWNGQLITKPGNWAVSDDTITLLFPVDTGDVIAVFLSAIRQAVEFMDLTIHNTSPLSHQNLIANHNADLNAHQNLIAQILASDIDCGTL